MKEQYQKPSISVVMMQPTTPLSISVNSVSSNTTGITYGGSSNSWARAGKRNDFEGEEDF